MIFLKLGGSLITEKDKPSTVRARILERVCKEIAAARAAHPGLRLLLGHGSGSFGHVPAQQHGTRAGVASPAQWRGFVEVWQQAAALDRLVMDALQAAGLPALAFPPLAATTAESQPAPVLTAPPRAADSAPCVPAESPATSVRTAVTINCQRRTVRIGLLSVRGLALMFPACGKAAKVYSYGAPWVNVLRRKNSAFVRQRSFFSN